LNETKSIKHSHHMPHIGNPNYRCVDIFKEPILWLVGFYLILSCQH